MTRPLMSQSYRLHFTPGKVPDRCPSREFGVTDGDGGDAGPDGPTSQRTFPRPYSVDV